MQACLHILWGVQRNWSGHKWLKVDVIKWSVLMRLLWMIMKSNYFSRNLDIHLTSDCMRWYRTCTHTNTRLRARVCAHTHTRTQASSWQGHVELGSSFPKVRVGCALCWKSFTDWKAWCNLEMVKTAETLGWHGAQELRPEHCVCKYVFGLRVRQRKTPLMKLCGWTHINKYVHISYLTSNSESA